MPDMPIGTPGMGIGIPGCILCGCLFEVMALWNDERSHNPEVGRIYEGNAPPQAQPAQPVRSCRPPVLRVSGESGQKNEAKMHPQWLASRPSKRWAEVLIFKRSCNAPLAFSWEPISSDILLEI